MKNAPATHITKGPFLYKCKSRCQGIFFFFFLRNATREQGTTHCALSKLKINHLMQTFLTGRETKTYWLLRSPVEVCLFLVMWHWPWTVPLMCSTAFDSVPQHSLECLQRSDWQLWPALWFWFLCLWHLKNVYICVHSSDYRQRKP